MIRNVPAMLGASLATVLVIQALGVLGASATTSGHFTTAAASGQARLDIAESTETTDRTTLTSHGTTFSCHNVHYDAPNLITGTVTGATVTANYTNCTTGEGSAVTVRMNGCHFFLTSRTEGHGTIHFLCPSGKKAELEWANGLMKILMKIGQQTPKGGAVYTTTEVNGIHALTVDITAEGITAECHGFCQFLGTTSTTAKLTGAVSVAATEVGEPYVGLTAT